MLAPQVIAMRTARMMAAGASPSARDRREFHRMGTEKVFAAWEAMNAMSLYAMQQWWTAAWLTPWSLASTTTRMFDKGLAPVHRRASANARRLRRLKSR